MSNLLAPIVFLASAAAIATSAGAQLVASYDHGTGPAGGIINASNTTFSNEGPYTLGGSPLGGRFGDLGSAPAGGTVYAVGTQGGVPNLFSIDTGTNATTLRGNITLNGNALVGAGDGGLAVAPSGTARLLANVGGVTALLNLSVSTGAATLLGNLTLNGSPLVASNVIGLASSPTGETYGALTVAGSTGLYTIADNGTTTFRGNFLLNNNPVGGIADIAFDASGTLYTLTSIGSAHSLFTVSPSTGVLTLRGNLDYVNPTPFTGLANIPAPSAFAVLVLAAPALGRRRAR